MRHPRALIVTYTIATAALLGGCHKSPPPAEVKDPAKPVESVAGHARPADAWSSLISEATAGKLQAQLLAAYAYSQGETVPRNLDEALRWYRAAAVQGSVAAEFSLGMLYCFHAVEEDPDVVYRLNLPLAEGGDPHAQCRVGVALLATKGLSFIKAGKEGVVWLQKAANANQTDAQYELARLHGSDNLITGQKNPELAVKWLRLAAPHRVEAKYDLATAMRWGNGTIKSEAMAAQLTREAAEAGHQQAAVDYSDMLASGFGGLAQDLAASREWLSKAEHLMPSSLRPKTAGEFFNGFEGPPHDAIRAHAWFNRASSKGYRRSDLSMSAQDAMYAIERFMSADDKRQAENLASSPELN